MKKVILLLGMFIRCVSHALGAELIVPIQDNWYVEVHSEGASAHLAVDKALVPSVARMDWDLGTGFWTQLVGRFDGNVDEGNTISFWIRGEGDNNRLTLKIADKDGSFFGSELPVTSLCPEWQEVKIPLSSMKWLWGGDYTFNKDAIDRIFFAVERSKGGKGTLFIKGVKFIHEDAGILTIPS